VNAVNDSSEHHTGLLGSILADPATIVISYGDKSVWELLGIEPLTKVTVDIALLGHNTVMRVGMVQGLGAKVKAISGDHVTGYS
jgi:hypothetical protein